MEPAGDCFVPGGFFSVTNGWKKRFGNVKIPTEAQLEEHMVSSGARFARQQMKGTMFQEEGYVRNVMYNDVSAESTCGLLRSICLPSMKGGYYIVHAAISKASGSILAGHCLCPAGLSGTCQHFVGLILHAIHLAQKDAATCTEVPCAWIVPAQVKKHEPPLPLQDITFHTRKHEGAKRRRFDPLPGLSPSDPSLLAADLEKVAANCLLLRYMSKENSGESLDEHSPSEVAPEASDTPLVQDIEDIHSETCQRLIQERFDAIQALSVDSRAVVLESTIGQAANPTWHMERIGRLTASMFKRIVRCRKPDSIVKEILYPRSYKTEAMHYGNVHEPDAVQAYEQLMACMDKTITVGYTGLHVHAEHPFIAAYPDRLVFEGSDMGLLEVKCLFSFKGKSIEEAAASPKFCCRATGNEITLKREHEYYYQLQGQMAVTGLSWCDFVVWTNAASIASSLHVERIFFDEAMWSQEILPALLHFYRNAVLAEELTQRIRRGLPLYSSARYVGTAKRNLKTCRKQEPPTAKICTPQRE
ncbi:uncharacterized protein [Dermacentor albipictus]|uniref:uncharacterized protein isoform X1 n=1 Tax=Dermacentor albipictus TaxID=60249 RepID=UPI0031FDEB8F